MNHRSEAQINLHHRPEVPVYRFVFTGGPCGGKTTALARVFSFLTERGFTVITCPEAFTTLRSNGMSSEFFGTEGMGTVIQDTVLQVQLALENGIYNVCKARGKPGVILCDRGTMDGSVYMDKEEFNSMLANHNTDVVQMRDHRYDAVFHLITAADGAEQHYTLENNMARTETKEEARKLDHLTQKAWLGHPHLYVLDNSTDFEGKMSRLVNIVSKIVGLPSNLKRRSAKFVLKSPPNLCQFPDDVDVQEFEVEKIYLQRTDQQSNSDNNYSFIRRRTSLDKQSHRPVGSVFQLTTAQRLDDTGELIEHKRIISEREYVASSLTRDASRHVVRQRRISFLFHRQSFTVHQYQQPTEGLCILHAQVEVRDHQSEPVVDLPPFLQIERRLTNSREDEKQYGAYSLSVMSNS